LGILIVKGSIENREIVEKTVNALSIFVPKLKKVLPWTDKLKLIQVGNNQIIGTSTHSVVPISVSSISSVLNIEEEILISPT